MPYIRRRMVLSVIVLLLCIALLVRYPLVQHERNQTDSYFIHNLSDDILQSGRAKWTVHPLSYFGYYPLSYPSGVPFLISEFSTISDMPVEGAILYVSLLLGMLFVLVCFVLLRLFADRLEIVIVGCLLATLASRFIDTTYWVGSARGLLTVLMLLVVTVLIRGSQSGDRRYLLLGAPLILVSVSVHHMATLLVILGCAYLLVVVGRSYVYGVRGRISRRLMIYYYLACICLSVVGLFLIPLLYAYARMSFSGTPLFDFQPEFLSTLFNASASYANQIGFVLPIAILAIPFALTAGPPSDRDMYPLAVLVVFIPMIGFSLYTTMILTPFVSLLAVKFLLGIRRTDATRKAAICVLVVLIASSFVLPCWSINRWNATEYPSGDAVVVDDNAFNIAAYSSCYYGGRYAVSNGDVLLGLLESIGTVHSVGSSMFPILSGDINASDISEGLRSSERSFPLNLYVWFEYDGAAVSQSFCSGLTTRGIGYIYSSSYASSSFAEYLSCHNRLLVVVDNNWIGLTVTSYGSVPTVFTGEVIMSSSEASDDYSGFTEFASYAVLATNRATLFVVQLPSVVSESST